MNKSILRLINIFFRMGLQVGCEFKNELIEHSLERQTGEVVMKIWRIMRFGLGISLVRY